MKSAYLTYCLFFLLFSQSINLIAQNETSVKYDRNGPVKIRTSDEIQTYLNDEAFQYDQVIEKAPETWWDKIKQKIRRFFWKLLKKIGEGGNAVSVIFYIIIFGILLFVIIKLLGFKYQGLFIRSSKIKDTHLEVFEEDIQTINFNEIIDNAIQKGNYRTAVRYMYIKFLKILADHELIEWEINKTNKDYYKEMKKTEYFSVFKRLTFVYEYVWYGEFPLTRVQFNDYRQLFSKMYKTIR